jgi:hypothetical protein
MADVERLKEFAQRIAQSNSLARTKSHGLSTAECAPTAPAPDNAVPAGDPKYWSTSGQRVFWSGVEVADQLPSGVYSCQNLAGIGFALVRIDVSTDGLLTLPEEATEDLLKEFERFWTAEDRYREFGLLWKRGFLLWGPPGSGKTSTINLMIHEVIERYDGIVIGVENPSYATHCLRMARQIEPKRPIICILEDLDAIVDGHSEAECLALLDGAAQIDNVVFVATTNYPEKLDRRFVDRPSRIDTIVYVPMPSPAARRAYLESKNAGLSERELEQWVEMSDGFSVAHLKEMIIAVKCLGQTVEMVCERLRAMQEIKLSSESAPDKGQAGFLAHLKHNGRGGHTNGRDGYDGYDGLDAKMIPFE